jgi:hypothetical protein
MEQPTQAEALRLADLLLLSGALPGSVSERAGIELRRLHAELESLRASKQAERAELGEAPGGAWQRALEIRTAQGWTLKGDRVPVLYTDAINGEQVCRDDLWLCTTAAAFSAPVQQAAPAGDAERKDAARYRWLRDTNGLKSHPLRGSGHLDPLQVERIYFGQPEDKWNMGNFAFAPTDPQDFDKAIDAAIASQQP